MIKHPGEDAYIQLARASVEHYVRKGYPLSRPADLPQEMLTEQAGVFVSLHEHGELRGCIGTIQGVRSCIADEIIMNAISACSEDPRFSPVEEDELDDLDINVDVLEKPESIESPADLDPQLYGVIVSRGMRRGLLLPRLEGVDTPDQQIAISKRKAGIGRFETVNLQRFEVTRHEVENDG